MTKDTASTARECLAQKDVMRVLSLGAGVQSSTVALMMEAGEIEPAEVAIFADTKAEPARVYLWLDWLEKQITKFPVVRVTEKNGITDNIEKSCRGEGWSSNPPLFVSGGGLLNRKCTYDFKLVPIFREIRCRLNGRKAVQVIGISFDERRRMRPPQRKYIAKNEYPLVDREMTRQDCLSWMQRNGYPMPPRSACVFCPFRCNAEWRKMRDLYPDDWVEACRVDDLMRDNLPCVRPTEKYSQKQCFVHRDLVPLREVNLDEPKQSEQLPGINWVDCEGMCGL